MVKLIAIIMIGLFSLFSCSKDDEQKDDELSLVRQNYSGNQLRVDGYYFIEKDGLFFSIYFFYKNGTIMSVGGGINQSELNALETEFANGMFYNKIKNNKIHWGIYNINNNKITFERWYPPNFRALPAYVRSGDILNDSTFQITQSMRSDGTEVEEENETYHFRAFSPKPDSTNSFIK